MEFVARTILPLYLLLVRLLVGLISCSADGQSIPNRPHTFEESSILLCRSRDSKTRSIISSSHSKPTDPGTIANTRT